VSIYAYRASKERVELLKHKFSYSGNGNVTGIIYLSSFYVKHYNNFIIPSVNSCDSIMKAKRFEQQGIHPSLDPKPKERTVDYTDRGKNAQER
jgi:hypothetical protein